MSEERLTSKNIRTITFEESCSDDVYEYIDIAYFASEEEAKEFFGTNLTLNNNLNWVIITGVGYTPYMAKLAIAYTITPYFGRK